jgi:hypothetical protein
MAKRRGAARAAAKKATKGKKTKRSEVQITGTDKALLDAVNKANAITGGMWVAEVIGDTITGEILAMKREDGTYQDDQLNIILSTPEGAKTIYCNWSLESGLRAVNANIGDRIAIQYREDVSIKRGRPMKAYAVVRAGGVGKKAADILTAKTPSRRNKGKGKRTRR